MLQLTRRVFLAAAGPAVAVMEAAAERAEGDKTDGLVERFRQPSDEDKPWVYWWWVNGNVTRRSITRDLEEMKKKGIAGFLMFDSRQYGDQHLIPPPSPMEFMSDEWRALLRFAMSEAHRLGLKMSMNLSTHGGSLRSPWETGADAPKKLIWTSGEFRGPRQVNCALGRPARPHFWDVALLAVRHRGAQESAPSGPVFISGDWRDVSLDTSSAPKLGDVLDLSAKVDAQGRLDWEAPEGNWTLLRFA